MSNFNLADYRLENGDYQAYAFPGGYPMYYLAADYGVLCPACVNANRELIEKADPDCPSDDQWRLIAADINYEGDSLVCENCGAQIEAAYSEEE